MIISKLTDASILFQLEKNNFNDYYSQSNCEAELNKMYFCAYVNNMPVGYIGVLPIQDQAEILRLAVNSEYRQRGVAQALLNYALSYLKKLNIQDIFLEVSDKNQNAINFYQKNNFKTIYTRKNYYNDSTNAIIMQRSV